MLLSFKVIIQTCMSTVAKRCLYTFFPFGEIFLSTCIYHIDFCSLSSLLQPACCVGMSCLPHTFNCHPFLLRCQCTAVSTQELASPQYKSRCSATQSQSRPVLVLWCGQARTASEQLCFLDGRGLCALTVFVSLVVCLTYW